MTGTDRMPIELTVGPQQYQRISEVGRWVFESELINEHMTELSPELRRKPTTHTDRFDGIEYVVKMDSSCGPNQESIRLRMLIPDDYPNSLPRVYPVDYPIHYSHSNHTYRDSDGFIHMCMLFEEDWTSDCTLAGLMVLSSIWMHKWMIWTRTGTWPGKGRTHCNICGRIHDNCKC